MYYRKIKFEDYDGNMVEGTYAFDMNFTEVLEWLTDSGYDTPPADGNLDIYAANMSNRDFIRTMKDLIYRAYGKRSADGHRFIKSKEVKDEFMETNAFSALFMELLKDSGKAVEFISKVVPKDMAAKVRELEAQQKDGEAPALTVAP